MLPQGGRNVILLHVLPFIYFLLGKIVNFFNNLISFIEFQLLFFVIRFVYAIIFFSLLR